MSTSIGRFIRERRQDLGLTQSELAARVGGGMSQSEISRLERDRIFLPGRRRLKLLAGALEVSIDDFLIGSGRRAKGEHHEAPHSAAPSSCPQRDRVEVIDRVIALQEVVSRGAIIQDQAKRMIAALLRSLDPEGTTGDVVRTEAGLFDEWETMAAFNA